MARPSSTGDADEIRPYNPLTRVPALVLDNGEVLIESHLILDYLDSLVPADRRMFPTTEPARHQALRFIGEAHPGLVSLTGFPALEAHAARIEAPPCLSDSDAAVYCAGSITRSRC